MHPKEQIFFGVIFIMGLLATALFLYAITHVFAASKERPSSVRHRPGTRQPLAKTTITSTTYNSSLYTPVNFRRAYNPVTYSTSRPRTYPTVAPTKPLVPKTMHVTIAPSPTDKQVESLKLLLFSAMNQDYVNQFDHYIEANRNYSDRYGYKYVVLTNSTGQASTKRKLLNSYYNRIYFAIDLLKGQSPYNGEPMDWIAYIDADAYIAEHTIPLTLLIKLANEYPRTQQFGEESSQCEFISQDYPHIANSGFWLIRNSSWSISFLERWAYESEKVLVDRFRWVEDQGPLQNTMLHVASQLASPSTQPYKDECRRISAGYKSHAANLCWKDRLLRLNYTYGDRIIGPICQIGPQRGVPWRFHMHYGYTSGDLVHHAKDVSRETIANYVPNVDYRPETGKLTYTKMVSADHE